MAIPTDDVGPLERARRRLGLTLSEIASRLGCSEAAVSRYVSGGRTSPPALFLLLGSPALAAEHEKWLAATGRKRKRGEVALTITARLPTGMTEDEAQRICTDALSSLVAGQREGAR